MRHTETDGEQNDSCPMMNTETYVTDELTNSALSDFPVQCVYRADEIRQNALHSHYGYECYFCVSGSGRFIAGDKVYEMNTGSLIIIDPLVLHMPRSAAGQPLHRLILSIEKKYLDRLCQVDVASAELIRQWLPGERSDAVIRQLNSSQANNVQEILVELERELADRQKGYTLAVQSLLLRLFTGLARHAAVQSPVRLTNERKKQLAEQMIRYLVGHYEASFRLEDMCVEFRLSCSYLQRIFKQETSVSIKEYLMAYRINRAKELLEGPGMPLIEVAFGSGFQDLSHFCHSFKRLTGVTPGRYRTLVHQRDLAR